MHREVASRIVVDVVQSAVVALQIAPAAGYDIAEELIVTIDGRAVKPRCVPADHGNRIHVVDATPGGS